MKAVCGFTIVEFLLALSLGALLCVGLDHVFSAMLLLQDRQMAIAHLQEKMRDITQILRTKIQKAGDWSCELSQPKQVLIRRYTANQAHAKLGINIIPQSDLLQLRECTHLHDQARYLPINFFVANNSRNQTALFIQITGHPREEMITGVRDLLVTLYKISDQKNVISAVKIDYLLSSEHFRVPIKMHYWFHEQWIIPKDFALYQSGILYVAPRL